MGPRALKVFGQKGDCKSSCLYMLICFLAREANFDSTFGEIAIVTLGGGANGLSCFDIVSNVNSYSYSSVISFHL